VQHYILIKSVHITAASLSILLFSVRLYWSVRGHAMLQQRWVRVVPHVIDTLLLVAGISLMVMLNAWPQQQPWLAAKLVGLLVYIGLGTIAIKRGRSPGVRLAAGLLAVLTFMMIVGAAWLHSPWSWLAPG